MSDLNDFRKLIDEQDQIIMEALEKRLDIVRSIGKFKQEKEMEITNSNREAEILKRCQNYQYTRQLKNIYQSIFSEAKRLQKQLFALIGQNIGHSLSPLFHREIANLDYQIVDTNNFRDFIEARSFSGINVTIPYKTTAYQMVDELSPIAKKTAVVNTIINDGGKLIGYNTDYLAFQRLLDTFHVNIFNKKVLIIGNGATARTVKAVLEQQNPEVIINLVRNLRGENEALISEYQEFKDYQIIINTTPYGSAPHFEHKPLFDLNDFYHLETVIDVLYQPLNSPLLKAARAVSDRLVINGLYMLIAQAFYADQLFLDNELDSNLIDKIYQKYHKELPNIVLIGMPYSGKTTIGQIIANLTNREFIDTDQTLTTKGQDLPTILGRGETVEQFRHYESAVIEEISYLQNKVIATGGGSLLNPKNAEFLKANGVLIWLSPSFDHLVNRSSNTRPLAKTTAELEHLYLERLNYYVSSKDIIINNNRNPEDDAKKTLEKFYEYLNY